MGCPGEDTQLFSLDFSKNINHIRLKFEAQKRIMAPKFFNLLNIFKLNNGLSYSYKHFCLITSKSSVYFHKFLILIPQRADRIKTTITESWSNWSHGPQPCLTQWNYEPCRVGPLKTDGSWWRVLTKRGPLEKGMANHFCIPALRTPWTVWKGKKIWHWKKNSSGQ